MSHNNDTLDSQGINNRVRGVKKSNFIDSGTTVITGSATFDYVESNTNKKVTFTNLLTQLGTTGQLVQVGDPLCTPVLDDQGTIKGIRNFRPGFGIEIVIDATECVEISTDFTFDETGVTLVDDVLSSSPTFRSLVAGAGIAVGGSEGIIQISLSGTPISTKTIIVDELGDLPTPVLGVITLADNTQYLFVNDVNIGINELVFGNNTFISAADSSIIRITCTGTGTMLTGVDVSCRISKIEVSCPNAKIFDISSTSGFDTFQFTDSTVADCDTVGDFTGLFITRIDDIAWENITTGGISFFGSCGAMVVAAGFAFVGGGSFIDLGTATFNSISIRNDGVILAPSTTFLSGASLSANINPGGLATVVNTRLSGTGFTTLSGITPEDALWEFFLNDDIPNTRTDALLSLQSNAINTTIAVISTPVLVAGVWVVEFVSQMAGTTSGRITLNTNKDVKLPITASLTVAPVSGGAQTISAYIAINGSVIANSQRSSSAQSGNPVSISVPWQENLSPADFVEIFVSNDSAATDVLVSSAILRIN